MRREDGTCWTCAKPRCCGRPGHMFDRLQWATKTARRAEPKSMPARLRLLWHDFVTHGLLNKGTERCQDCGHAYGLWHAANDVWLRVMGDMGGQLCPGCFATREAA